jgi:putative effector of murein hydrolase
VIQILVDPRFAAPLLIVLDFVIAYMVLALTDYALRFFQIEILNSIVWPIAGVALFLPLLREALRLRRTLQTEWRNDKKIDSD